MATPLPTWGPWQPSGIEINSLEENSLVLSNIEELQEAWDTLSHLLEEKDAALQVREPMFYTPYLPHPY